MQKGNAKNSLLLLFSLTILACAPQPPGKNIVSSTEILESKIELNKMSLNSNDLFNTIEDRPTNAEKELRGKNLIYVAVENQYYSNYRDVLKLIYLLNPNPRIEDVSWWYFAPKFQKHYDLVLRITYDNFSQDSLQEATAYLEKHEKPYDIILMTHGKQDIIAASNGQNSLRSKDIEEFAGKLNYLNMVYMQGCYGATLNDEWINAGASYVLGYLESQVTFFYLEYLLDSLLKNSDVPLAYELTNKTLIKKVKENPMYSLILNEIVNRHHVKETNLNEYLKNLLYPELATNDPEIAER